MTTLTQNPLSQTEAEQLLKSPQVRKKLRETFLGFCLIYLPHYFRLPPADFHPELLSLLQSYDEKFVSVMRTIS